MRDPTPEPDGNFSFWAERRVNLDESAEPATYFGFETKQAIRKFCPPTPPPFFHSQKKRLPNPNPPLPIPFGRRLRCRSIPAGSGDSSHCQPPPRHHLFPLSRFHGAEPPTRSPRRTLIPASRTPPPPCRTCGGRRRRRDGVLPLGLGRAMSAGSQTAVSAGIGAAGALPLRDSV